MNIDALEDALIAAVLAASGLPAGKVIWADQGRTRPARPFIEVDTDDLPDNQHEEQTYRLNPSPTADTPAVWQFAQYGIPNVNGTISTVALGSAVPYCALTIDVTPGAGPFPIISYNPNAFGLGLGQLIIRVGAAGMVTTGAVNAAINTAPFNATFVSALTGAGLFTADQGQTRDFFAGTNGTDTFLIDNVTHPEISVQLRCYSTQPRGSQSARALLKATSKKLGALILTEQLDAAGIAVITRGTIQDVSAELQNEYEGRAVMGLTIRTADKLTETADRFDKVAVETTVDRDNGNPPIVTTITVDT